MTGEVTVQREKIMGLILHVFHIQVVPSLAISYIGTADLSAHTETGNIGPSAAEARAVCSQSYCLLLICFSVEYTVASDKQA